MKAKKSGSFIATEDEVEINRSLNGEAPGYKIMPGMLMLHISLRDVY